MYKEFSNCKLCPRECNANRNMGEAGFCGALNAAEVNRIDLHFMEEPCISGINGSGTVFFSHCTLGCVYCQNYKISRQKSKGKIYSARELAQEYLNLENKGAHNINLVTPTHYMPVIVESIKTARNLGLKIPFVYNTSGFEKAENIEKLEGIIDIFLTDLKYVSPYLSKKYSFSPDYYDYAKPAIDAMIKITGNPKYDKSGMLKSGTIIRHLILPTQISDTLTVLRKIYNNWSNTALVSLMRQYTPISSALSEELKRTVTDAEYKIAAEEFLNLNLEGFLQDKNSIGTDKIPIWDK